MPGLGSGHCPSSWGLGVGSHKHTIAEVSAGASQSFWLCGDAKCLPLRHPFWALLEILGLVHAQDCAPEGAAGNRTRTSGGAGEDGEQCPLSPSCLQGEQWHLLPCCPALPSGSAFRAAAAATAAWGNKTL